MDKEFFIWQACALKAASDAINKECLSVLRDKQIKAEDKLIALRAMLQTQDRIEVSYLQTMKSVKE